MRSIPYIFCMWVVLSAAAVPMARADFAPNRTAANVAVYSPTARATEVVHRPTESFSGAAALLPGYETAEMQWMAPPLPSRSPSAACPTKRGVPSSGCVIRSTPREEARNGSSAALLFSVMVSVGGWHLVRSARHVRIASLPDWYHTGAPLKIGRTVVYDFQPPALAVFPDSLLRDDPRVGRHALAGFEIQESPDAVNPANPRAPPRSS